MKRRSTLTEVIILTGTHAKDIDCAIWALRLGAHDFLTKQNAEQVVLAVERAMDKKRLQEANLRLMRELEAQTRTDALTGAANRRAFEGDLERELALSARYGVPLSLLLTDLDHFKDVNDSCGHLAGDEILKGVVRTLADELRNTDILYRNGGDEFAVLLPHTGEGFFKKKELTGSADAAVYTAKRDGRNRARTRHIAA